MTPGRKPFLLAAAGCSLLALVACDDRASRSRVDVPDPTPLALAAPPAGLPYAEPLAVDAAPVARGYASAERAYTLQRRFYDEAPAYAFDYGGEEPYAWRTADDWTMYAEPYDGGYRYYYYEPEAAYPYFVQDADYGYGFDQSGVLVAVFDSSGGYLAPERMRGFASTAGRYYARGRDLRNAAAQAPRAPVSAAAWRVRAPAVARSAEPWLRAAQSDNRWRAWRTRGGERSGVLEPLPGRPDRGRGHAFDRRSGSPAGGPGPGRPARVEAPSAPAHGRWAATAARASVAGPARSDEGRGPVVQRGHGHGRGNVLNAPRPNADAGRPAHGLWRGGNGGPPASPTVLAQPPHAEVGGGGGHGRGDHGRGGPPQAAPARPEPAPAAGRPGGDHGGGDHGGGEHAGGGHGGGAQGGGGHSGGHDDKGHGGGHH